MSMQRHNVASTFMRRCINGICTPGKVPHQSMQVYVFVPFAHIVNKQINNKHNNLNFAEIPHHHGHGIRLINEYFGL